MPRRDGGIERRVGAGGQVTWRARWYDVTGHRQSASFDTKAEAEAWLADKSVEMRRGGSGSMEDRRTTLAEWWERWQSGRQVSLLASRREQSAWECRARPHLGNVRLADIRRSTVQAWVAGQVRAGLAPSTITRHVGILHACLSAAVLDGLIAANPASKADLPRVPKAEQRFLSVDEVRRLTEATRPAYRSMVAVGVARGLRIGELVALRVEDFDFLRRTVTVRRTALASSRRPGVEAGQLAARRLATGCRGCRPGAAPDTACRGTPPSPCGSRPVRACTRPPAGRGTPPPRRRTRSTAT